MVRGRIRSEVASDGLWAEVLVSCVFFGTHFFFHCINTYIELMESSRFPGSLQIGESDQLPPHSCLATVGWSLWPLLP